MLGYVWLFLVITSALVLALFRFRTHLGRAGWASRPPVARMDQCMVAPTPVSCLHRVQNSVQSTATRNQVNNDADTLVDSTIQTSKIISKNCQLDKATLHAYSRWVNDNSIAVVENNGVWISIFSNIVKCSAAIATVPLTVQICIHFNRVCSIMVKQIIRLAVR